MKKLIPIFVTIAMLISLCACGENSKKETNPTNPNNTEISTTPQFSSPEETAPPVFFEEAQLVTEDQNGYWEKNHSAAVYGYFARVLGVCDSGIGKPQTLGIFEDSYVLSPEQNCSAQSYHETFSIAKYYGNGIEQQEHSTNVNIVVSEIPLVTQKHFQSLAKVQNEVDGLNRNSYSSLDEYQAAIEQAVAPLSTKYAEHKIISCSIEFSWGNIDQDLWKETGNVFANIGFELIDKYTGTAFSPNWGTSVIDQVVAYGDEEYTISVFMTGCAWPEEGTINSRAVICAVVPTAYDGAVFAIGNGNVDLTNTEENVKIINHKESALFGATTTRYYAYENSASPQFSGLFSVSAPEHDVDATVCQNDIAVENSNEFAIGTNFNYSADGSWNLIIKDKQTLCVDFQNKDINPVGIIVVDNNNLIVGQSGLILPGEAIYSKQLADLPSADGLQFGIIHYKNGEPLLAELVSLESY